jgi:ferredoxin-NADP reductase
LIRASTQTRIVRLALDSSQFLYRAGQSVQLGLHGQPLRKYYSIASAPEEARRLGYLEFLVKVEADEAAAGHVRGLKRGSLVDIEGPFGRFWIPDRPAERRFLFVAGGTGIAPVRAMLRQALLTGLVGTFAVIYSARTPGEFVYAAELRALARLGRIRLVLTATRGAHQGWRGARGRIARSTLASLIRDPATLCFLCGPAAFTATVVPLLRELGISSRRIKVGES